MDSHTESGKNERLALENKLGWRLKPDILAQGGLNVNERHQRYY